jgi:hypothetical protein
LLGLRELRGQPMKWVRIPINVLTSGKIASLPADLWRLLVEYDLLCGKNDGPIANDYETNAWLLHRDPAALQQATLELIASGQLIAQDGYLLPLGWLERNEPYLKKLSYNRERYHREESTMSTVDEDWEALPGNGGRLPLTSDALANLRSSTTGNAIWQVWAAKQPLLAKAMQNVQHISWLLSVHAGMLPYGTAKGWTQAVLELEGAANHDLALLEVALHKAVKDRTERGITLTSPRSFCGYARNEVSKQRLAETQLALDLDQSKPTVTFEV